MKHLASSAVLVMTIIGVLVVVALILSTGLGAVGRYLGLSGVTWSFEMVGVLFLWTTAIGAVLSEVAGENVSIDGNTSTSGRNQWFRVYHNLILLSVAGAFLWSGTAMLARTGFVPTPVMRVPSWAVQSMIVFMGAALAVIAIARIVSALRERG
ncbi:TRAP transporter small permease subunit [Sinorhizobium meliloti]|uniref:TRAP transporter small permease protein n=2 Tax=Rhizobium meliloti TaxID=382 RepID=A0A6A7ZV03_RHIML|nr:TRAP transporter small permease subunit [Sinorhizobium meliloti]